MGLFDSCPTMLPPAWAIAIGQVGNSNSISGRAQGYLGTTNTSGKPVRATAYAAQGTNAQRSLKSSNVNDNISGSGAQSVTINYLNTSFQLKSDTVWLSGTLAARTNATDIAFIENMLVAQVGADGGNDGTISIFTDTAGTGSIWGSIAPSDNQTMWCHHYVPSGLTCYIIMMTCGATIATGQANINHSGNPLSTNTPQQQIGPTLIHQGGATWDHEFEVPLGVTGPDLIWIVERPTYVTGSQAANGSTAVAGFEYVQF